MGRLLVRPPVVLDLTTLSLDGFWRGFAQSPSTSTNWVGTASAGASGTHPASNGSTPPTAGAPINGHPVAHLDGSDDYLALSGTAADYMADETTPANGSFSGFFLFKATAAAPHDLAAPYNEPALVAGNGGLVGVTFSAAGFGVFHWTDVVGWKSVHVECPTGEWHVGTFSWNGSTKTLAVGLDGPPTHSTFCLPIDTSLSLRQLFIGKNFDSTAFFAGDVEEAGITKGQFTDHQYRDIVASLNRRAALSLTQVSNYEAGTYAGTDSPVHTYVGTTKTTTADFSQRDGAKLHPFAGKYFLLGGWASSGRPDWNDDQTTNQVWSSTNLVNWTLELAHVSLPPTSGAGARWKRRHAFGTCVIGSYLYVVGGDQYVDGIPDVWRTTNPADANGWERRCAAAPWGGKVGLGVGSYGTEIHVIGGMPYESAMFYPASSQHYVSTDGGTTWKQLPDAPFKTSFITQLVEHDGLLFVIAGNGGSIGAGERVYQNSVWAWNGSKWRLQCSSPPFAGRMWVDYVAYHGKLWMLAGRDSDTTDLGEAWYSRDAGQTWTQVLAAPWTGVGTHADGVCSTVADGIVMASGFGINRSVYTLKVAP